MKRVSEGQRDEVMPDFERHYTYRPVLNMGCILCFVFVVFMDHGKSNTVRFFENLKRPLKNNKVELIIEKKIQTSKNVSVGQEFQHTLIGTGIFFDDRNKALQAVELTVETVSRAQNGETVCVSFLKRSSVVWALTDQACRKRSSQEIEAGSSSKKRLARSEI